MTAERDSVNKAAEENLPPVLPHELIKLHGTMFAAIVRKQQNGCRNGCWHLKPIRLSKTFNS